MGGGRNTSRTRGGVTREGARRRKLAGSLAWSVADRRGSRGRHSERNAGFGLLGRVAGYRAVTGQLQGSWWPYPALNSVPCAPPRRNHDERSASDSSAGLASLQIAATLLAGFAAHSKCGACPSSAHTNALSTATSQEFACCAHHHFSRRRLVSPAGTVNASQLATISFYSKL